MRDESDDIFFGYRDLETEIRAKLRSTRTDVAAFWRRLDDLAGLYVSVSLHELFEILRRTGVSTDCAYLKHAIRVAATFVRPDDAAAQQVAFALSHGIPENHPDLVPSIDRFVGPRERRWIDVVAIDRARERDPAYLTDYYDAIVETSPELMFFKGLDKLDNFLSYDDDIDDYHFDVVVTYVLPRLRPINERLASYLTRLIAHLRPRALNGRAMDSETGTLEKDSTG